VPNRFRALAISLLALALGVPALPAAPAAAHGRSDRACAWPIRADRETLNVAYPDTGATNKSAVHWDMIAGAHDAEIAADGIVFYRAGKFTI